MKKIVLKLVVFLLFVSGFCVAYGTEDSTVEQKYIANSWRYKNGEVIFNNSEDSNDEQSAPRKSARYGEYHPNSTKVGIDVSAYQGKINWEKVKASGIDFAIIRCGYAENLTKYDDSRFERNASECERLGIPYGVYLYSYATTTAEASNEADHALRLIKGHKLSFPVYFDMEDKSTIGCNYAALAKTFCEKIESKGYSAGVYANLNWWNNKLTDRSFNKWHRWVAQYYYRCDYKGKYTVWQYTSSGSVNGINGNVDMDYLIGYPENHGDYTSSVEEATYTFSNLSTGNDVLSVSDGSYEDKASISMADASPNISSQHFEVIALGNKKYMILAEHSGKALSINENSGGAEQEVYQDAWNGKDSQIWEFINNGDGNYYIKSQSGKYLTIASSGATGAKITTTDLYKRENQIWEVKLSEQKPIEEGVYTLESISNSGKLISVEDSSLSDSANIGLEENKGLFSQQFYVKYEGIGYYSISAEHSNKRLQVKEGSYTNGIDLQQAPVNSVRRQWFKFIDDGNGNYYIKSKTGTTVTASGNNVNMELIMPVDQQKWKLKKVDVASVEDGTYTIQSNKDKQFALTSVNKDPAAYDYSALIEQKYNIVNADNGYYKIENIVTGEVLDVKNGSNKPGTKVQEHSWNGTDAQLWRIIDIGNGQYLIKSKKGPFLDVKNGSLKNSNEILINDRNDNSSQIWRLSKTKIVFAEPPEQNADDVINNIFASEKDLRIAGDDRYQTSLQAANVLKKGLGVDNFENVVIASGQDFPDALSGSYLAGVKNAPILLENDSNAKQVIDYMEDNLKTDGVIYILGGEGAVSEELERDLERSHRTKRLAGQTRYDTNLEILKECGISGDELLVCSGEEFADSLSVSSTGKPILLVGKAFTDEQIGFLEKNNVNGIYIIGGTGAVNTKIEKQLGKHSETTRIAGITRYTTSMAVAEAFFGNWSNCVVLAYGHNFPDGLSGGPLAMSVNAPLILTSNDAACVATAQRYARLAGVNKVMVMGGKLLISDESVNRILN